MSRKNVNFRDKKTEKAIKIDDIDDHKLLVSKEEPYGKRKFILILYRI